MLALIYDPAAPNIVFWCVASLIGATVGLSLFFGFVALQNWKGK